MNQEILRQKLLFEFKEKIKEIMVFGELHCAINGVSTEDSNEMMIGFFDDSLEMLKIAREKFLNATANFHNN